MELISLIISIVSGVAGGVLAGTALGIRSLGLVGNALAGLFGGTVAGYILQALGYSSGTTTTVIIESFVANLCLGAASGAILAILIGLFIGATSQD